MKVEVKIEEALAQIEAEDEAGLKMRDTPAYLHENWLSGGNENQSVALTTPNTPSCTVQ